MANLYVELVEFDFIMEGKYFLKNKSIQEYIDAQQLSTENVLKIEFFEATRPPRHSAVLEQDDWISAIKIGSEFVLTGSYDGMGRIWTKTGDCVASMPCFSSTENAGSSFVKSVNWISSKSTCLLAGHSQSIFAYGIKSNQSGVECELDFECVGHSGTVEALALNKSETLLASGSWDQTVSIWTTSNDDETVTVAEDDAAPKKKSKHAKTSSRHATQKRIKSAKTALHGHSGAVKCLTFDEGSQQSRLFSGGMDHSIRQWDLERESSVHMLDGDASVQTMAWNERQGLLATGHSDRKIRLWDMRLNTSYKKYGVCGFAQSTSQEDAVSNNGSTAASTQWVSSIVWSPDNEYQFATAGYSSQGIHIWDIRGITAIQSNMQSKSNYNALVKTLRPANSDVEVSNKIFALDWANGLLISVGEDCKMQIYNS